MEKFWFTFKWTFNILGGLYVLLEIVIHPFTGLVLLIPYLIIGNIIHIAEKKKP